MNIKNREKFFLEAHRVLKKGSSFAFSEHGLGPLGDPIYPLPWADNADMSFLEKPEKTIKLLEKIFFQNINFIETGAKYIAGYSSMLKKVNLNKIKF